MNKMPRASCQLPVAEFSELVRLVYEGPFERIPWQSALMQLRALVDARFVSLSLMPALPDQDSVVITSTLNGIEVINRRIKPHYVINPFNNLPNDRMVTVEEFLGKGVWEQSEFYRRQIARTGIRYFMGADIRSSEGVQCVFRVARVKGQQPFSESDKALSEMVLPHLKLAVHIRSLLDRTESERMVYSNAVERMLIGTIILDEKGIITKISLATQKILDRKDGIEVVNGTLRLHSASENRELQRMIEKALGAAGAEAALFTTALSVSRPSGRAKLSILVRPIPLGPISPGVHRPSVAVFIRDPESPLETPEDVVRQLFGLTPAEASLALLMANGLSLEEAAEKLDIRKNTARAHLRSIFSKTGVTRQTELVRVLLHSVISLA